MKKFIFIVLTILTFSINCFSNDESIFSDEEKSWLEENPVIKVAAENDYAPIEYYDNGKFIGLSTDYLNWISENYGIEFEYVYYDTWTQILNALKNKEVDLQSAIVKTPERLEYLSFSDSYADIPNVVLIRKSFEEKLTIDNIFNYRVGVIRNYAVHEYIMLQYAPSYIKQYDKVEESLIDLSLGKIDALVLDLAQASYYIQNMAISNIIISEDVKIDFDYKLRFAANKDLEILISIMDKTIDSMPVEVRQNFQRKWIAFGEYNLISNRNIKILLTIIGLIAIIFILVLIWSATLKKKVRIKTKQLNLELEHSKKMEKELSALTNNLEDRIKKRSESLIIANRNLENSMNEIKVKEYEVSKINKILEKQIQTLEETQAQLVESEKINALSRLVVGIAHELNTPLGRSVMTISYIEMKIGLLKEQVKFLKDKDVVIKEIDNILEYINKVMIYINQTTKIIDEFKLVADYNYKENLGIINLDENIENIVNIVKKHEYFKNYTFNLKLEKNINVQMSQGALLQIISELLENCYYHGYKKAKSGEIDISIYLVEDKVNIAIKDYGEGMSQDIKEKIFEPFYTSMRGSERIGLGLYSVYNIVTGLLNGKVFVETKEGVGTTIIIELNNN